MRLIVFTWHSFVVLCVLFLTGFNTFANGSGRNAPSFQQYLTDKTGVMFQPCAIVPGLGVYEVRQSGNGDAKKKHCDSRDGHKVDFLVLHYTDCNVITTLRAFTSGQGDNRQSSHYVITQDECVAGGQEARCVFLAESPFVWFQKISPHGTRAKASFSTRLSSRMMD